LHACRALSSGLTIGYGTLFEAKYKQVLYAIKKSFSCWQPEKAKTQMKI
jgi:hypothetical protein